ncbi:hypothetical protein B296_00013822 [Ensete ventricosum]|uniref:Uncharacterized protein n=1 Tax=Ensete ventricosum TaxID=4639 RepID=A0A426XUI1_ENSVE|nr:hypothetical protein B296_00013822 [Ensete ventricosum]
MVDRLQPPPPILLPPSTQELREHIRGVSLQRSIIWILLEKRMLDLLHPDLEIYGYMISLAKAPCKGATRCGQGQPVGVVAHRRSLVWATAARGHSHLQHGAHKERPPTASLQGATSVARAAASMSSDTGRRSGCRWARAVVAYVGAVATTQRGQEGLEQSFCEKG